MTADKNTFEDLIARSGSVVSICFNGDGRERGFTNLDVELAHRLATLPNEGKLPVAFVSGSLGGADLALALFCPMITIQRAAILATGFGRPGSAAVYVSAARHIGAASCERLLFGSTDTGAAKASELKLARLVADAAEALEVATSRATTLLCVARANLLTYPLSLEAIRAIVDGGH